MDNQQKRDLTLALLIAIVSWLILVTLAQGQERVTRPSDVIAFVAADAAAFQASGAGGDLEFQRYVWLPPWRDRSECWRLANTAINLSFNRTGIMVQPVGGPRDGIPVVRYDLRLFGRDATEVAELALIWDEIAITNRHFYAAQIVQVVAGDHVCPHCGVKTGVTHEHQGKSFRCGNCYEIFVVQFAVTTQLGPHLDPESLAGLGVVSSTFTPVVTSDLLMKLATTTLNGGRYYDLRGMSGKTRDEILTERGVNIEVFKDPDLNGVQRIPINRSGATGKSRVVLLARSSQGIHGDGTALGTLDVNEEQEAEGLAIHDAISSPSDFQHAAEEWIMPASNGLPECWLNDDKGVLQDSAPDVVFSADSTIPITNGSPLLQPVLSCVVCHGPHDMVQPAPNDLKRYARGRLNIVDDLGQPRVFAQERVQVLASQAGGRVDMRFRNARGYYSEAFRLASTYFDPVTGVEDGWSTPKEGPQPNLMGQVAAALGRVIYGWTYDDVTSQIAALELGMKCEDEAQAIAYLSTIIPNGVPEWELGAIAQGLPLKRTQWRRVYPRAAFLQLQAEKAAEAGE